MGRVAACVGWLSDRCKYHVAVTVFTICVVNFGPKMIVTMIGAVTQWQICLSLKSYLKHPRPSTAHKQDYGMPSAHAWDLAWLAMTGTLLLDSYSGASWSTRFALTAVMWIYALCVVYSLIYISFDHTLPQVLVGLTMGTSLGVIWFWFCRAFLYDFFTDNVWTPSVDVTFQYLRMEL